MYLICTDVPVPLAANICALLELSDFIFFFLSLSKLQIEIKITVVKWSLSLFYGVMLLFNRSSMAIWLRERSVAVSGESGTTLLFSKNS